MCGIAGIAFSDGVATPDAAELERMIRAIRHRGPDGFGFHRDAGIGLAHARLSIIDLATGDQPIGNEDNSLQIVFNGEIFNYLELRQELLQLGHGFRTQSDTEVIVHAYEHFGIEGCLERFNGQFAFALWDRRRRQLTLARDRVGIRPLFYALFRGGIAFASEQKSLFAGGRVAAEVSLRGVIDVAHFWAPQAPNSSFKNIVALPPGHYATFQLGRTSTRCYWDWDFASRDAALPAHSFASHVDQLRALFEDAVRLQLRSDVPVGSYLSGGLDSAAVTAAIKRQGQTALTTFSITFEDAEFDESAQQRMLAQELGTRHVSRPVTAQEIGASLPRAIEHIEAPLVRTAGIPLMLLAELVRSSGFKVVLTGEGADEVFAGYDIFKESQIRRFWARAPQSSWRPALLHRLYGYVANSPTRQIAFARSFFGKGLDQIDSPWFAHQTRIESTSRVLRLLSSDARAAVAKDCLIEELFSRLPIPNPAWRALERDQYVEAHTLLTNYLLAAQGDRVAMAASIEGRYPYLDHRLIEFASRLPPRWKLRGLREKHILREAVAPWLTNDVVQRPKQPYRAPDSHCFFANGKPLDYVAELLSPRAIDRAGLFDSKAVENLSLKCARGLASGFSDNMAFMIVLSTQQLHQAFIAKSA